MTQMMTAQQLDYIQETFNIAIGESVNQLSQLLSDEIKIDVPTINVSKVADLEHVLDIDANKHYVSVSQSMRGVFVGNVSLLFTNENSKILMESFVNGFNLDDQSRENLNEDALKEISNIILTSSIGALGELIEKLIDVSAPMYKEAKFSKHVQSETNTEDLETCLAVTTRLTASKKSFDGFMIFICDEKSVDTLIEKTEQQLEKLRQLGMDAEYE